MSVSVDGQHCEFLSFEFADESLAKLFSLGHNTAVCCASNEGDGGRFLSAIRAGTFRVFAVDCHLVSALAEAN
jgi:hypothetical protein